IETIVTSMAGDGSINFAPMGVEWGDEIIVLKPFLETTTFRNLRESRAAVVNLTDDVMLFAQGAISSPQFPWRAAAVVRGAVLEAAPATEIRVDGPDRDRAEEFARRFLGYHELATGVRLVIHRTIPPHSGLGSGTQLGLAVARAMAELTGLPVSPVELARAVS